MLPGSLVAALKQHTEQVNAWHAQDLAEGFGEVCLPFASVRKYPNTAWEWGWRYVFPAAKRSVDPRSDNPRRHHIDEKRGAEKPMAGMKRSTDVDSKACSMRAPGMSATAFPSKLTC
jgi:hypothetical protein